MITRRLQLESVSERDACRDGTVFTGAITKAVIKSMQISEAFQVKMINHCSVLRRAKKETQTRTNQYKSLLDIPSKIHTFSLVIF